jgi:outer membrane biosynthesis protein TonB
MTVAHRRAGLIVAASALVGIAACGNNTKPMDEGLKQDLAAAGSSGLMLPNSASPQLVVSPDEAGPTSAPKPATHKPVPRPTAQPAPRLAADRAEPVEAPAPQPVTHAPAPSAPVQQAEPAPAPMKQAEPAPLPPDTRPSRERQKGVYKSEGEIFRQMPWIKP